MPVYPLSLPASLKPKEVKLRKHHVVARNTSPFTLEAQTYVHSGIGWLLDISFAPIKLSDADAAILFYQELQGLEGSFNINVSTYDESQSGDTTVAFRLISGHAPPAWNIREGVCYFDKLVCEEAL